MVMLTVIGKRLAKVGAEFTYMGPISNCKECKVRNICFHLEKGRKYRIVSTRTVKHDCPLHEEGVVVVEVTEVPRPAVIAKKTAIEGSKISYETPSCHRRLCEHRLLCFLPGLEPGQKKKVLKVQEKVNCPIGQNRVCVLLE